MHGSKARCSRFGERLVGGPRSPSAASEESLDLAEDTRDAEMGCGHDRDPELATTPAIRAMRTKSESDDACILVIRLAR